MNVCGIRLVWFARRTRFASHTPHRVLRVCHVSRLPPGRSSRAFPTRIFYIPVRVTQRVRHYLVWLHLPHLTCAPFAVCCSATRSCLVTGRVRLRYWRRSRFTHPTRPRFYLLLRLSFAVTFNRLCTSSFTWFTLARSRSSGHRLVAAVGFTFGLVCTSFRCASRGVWHTRRAVLRLTFTFV